MNFRDLEYFVAITEQGHFGKASRALNVSQPTLSMQFKKLEEALGAKLIERLPGGAILTGVGEEVLPMARQILHLADDLKRRCGAKESKGGIKLGIIPTIAPYLLPKLNRSLSSSFKDRKISLTEAQTADLIRFVKDGSLDAAILSTPLKEPGIEEIEIFSEPFYLAVHRGHRLARRDEIRPGELKDEAILLLEEGHCLRNQALSICSLTRATNDTDLSATSIETLRSMVALGTGVTLIPQLAIRKGDNLCYVPFSESAPSRKVGVIYRSSFYDLPFVMELCDIIRNAAKRDKLPTFEN